MAQRFRAHVAPTQGAGLAPVPSTLTEELVQYPYPAQITVTVTQADIDAGEPCGNQDCPLALALMREPRIRSVSVRSMVAVLGFTLPGGTIRRAKFDIDDAGQHFISTFDKSDIRTIPATHPRPPRPEGPVTVTLTFQKEI